MWPWVLGSAALGGLQAYQQSGGDIGKTLTGAAIGGGLGLAAPGITRFAGGALAGTPLATKLAPGVYKAAQAFAGKEGASSLISPIAQQLAGKELLAKGAAGLTGLGLSAAIPAAAAGIAGAGRPAGAAPSEGAGPIRTAGRAAGLYQAATQKPTELVQPAYSSTAVPGGMAQPSGTADVFNPLGAYQADIMYQKQLQDVSNQNVMRLANYEVKLSDEVKRRDLLRNAAAAKLKTDLATTSALMLGGQQIAGAQASQALADIGATARTQYQYL